MGTGVGAGRQGSGTVFTYRAPAARPAQSRSAPSVGLTEPQSHGAATESISAVYDATLSRVRVTADGLAGAPTYAVVDRSTDLVNWTTVRGASSVTLTDSAIVLPVDDYEFPADTQVTYRVRSYTAGNVLTDTLTVSITVDLGFIWLKFVAAPYLNRKVTLVGWGEISRKSRTGVFQVTARREPIVVTDLHTTRSVTIQLYTSDNTDTQQLDTALSLGVPVFLHVPSSCTLPTMYVALGDYSYDKPSVRSVRGRFTVPLNEAAAPAASVVGSSATWQTLLSTYTSWNDVFASNATWRNVADLIGSPTDIIVGA